MERKGNKKCSNETKASIISLYKMGVPRRKMCKELNITTKTAVRWTKQYNETGSIASKKRKSVLGTTEEERVNILNYVREKPLTNAAEIKRDLKLKVTSTTIRRFLATNGIKHYTPVKKVILSDANKRQRLEFAKEYIKKDNSFWENVIFSDETSFTTEKGHCKHVYRKTNTRFSNKNISQSDRSGRKCCSMWGWISAYGPGELTLIEGSLNGKQYVEIMEDIMVPTVRAMVFPKPQKILFMQDNCPAHKCKYAMKWFENQKDITLINWPPKSPDLNPIETVWALMKKKDISKSKNKKEIEENCTSTWESLRGTNTLKKLYDSIPQKLQAVIDAAGGHIKG